MLIPNTYSRSGDPKYELQIRSFFESQLSGQKCWDEPPSGAESIQYANDEMRRMAEMEKSSLECVTESGDDVLISSDNNNVHSGSGRVVNKKQFGRKVKNLFQRRKKNNAHSQTIRRGGGNRQISVREGSLMAEFLNGSKDSDYNPNQSNLEYALAQSFNDLTTEDVNGQVENGTRSDLEKAIALSVSESQRNMRNSQQEEEDDEIALATALSLSLNEMGNQSNEELADVASEEKVQSIISLENEDRKISPAEVHEETTELAESHQQTDSSLSEQPLLNLTDIDSNVVISDHMSTCIHSDKGQYINIEHSEGTNEINSELNEIQASTKIPDSFEIV